MKTKQLILISVFAALIAIGAQISIPIGPLPITLQVPMVILAGSLLGPRYGVFSLVVYLLLGLIGIPVFAGGIGGFSAFISPSFGFVIGFIALAFFAGISTHKKHIVTSGLILVIGVGVMFMCGLLYFYLLMNYVVMTPIELTKAIRFTVTPFIIKDLIIAVGTLMLSRLLVRRGLRINF